MDTEKIKKIAKTLKRIKKTYVFSYYIQTFGCQMNYADTEKIQEIFLYIGGKKEEDMYSADVVIFNTCSVRQKGEDRVFGMIENVYKRAKKEGRKIFIWITGCMVRKTGISEIFFLENIKKQKKVREISYLDRKDSVSIFNNQDRLFLRSKKIDFTLRIEEISFLPKILTILLKKEVGGDHVYEEYFQVKQLRNTSGKANIIIQSGCDNYCTFCIVPYTRGREKSREIEEIFNEVQDVVSSWAKEITLLGQNVNSYGKEQGRYKWLWNSDELTWKDKEVFTPFGELLKKLDTISGLDRIRFTSSNPHDMTRDILDAHFNLEKTCNYLHFALQSGSNEMLKKMNRKHSYEDFKKQVKYLRSKDPYFSISTDIIVGFPGETEEMFQDTVRAFRELDFDFAYIARYSERKGTTASKHMKDDISPEEKARRWDILNQELFRSITKRNKKMIGKKERILVDKITEKEISGRTRNFKEICIPFEENISLGDFISVEILEMRNWVLLGKKI